MVGKEVMMMKTKRLKWKKSKCSNTQLFVIPSSRLIMLLCCIDKCYMKLMVLSCYLIQKING